MKNRLLSACAVLSFVLACAQTDVASETVRDVPPVDPPAVFAEKAEDFAGLHNVVAFGESLYSGSVPEGEAGFDTLQGMGIRTIISVDGAMPDVEEAKARGMRYVHLPIGYNGMTKHRTLEIAKAIDTLPGPVYLHCHHGKHRSAGAAGAAAVTLGRLTSDQATKRMKVSGTAPNYTGLYQCTAIATPATKAELAAVSTAFPERSKPNGFVATMIEIDVANDQLKAIEKAGWKAPKDHPDLVPVAVAGHLADLLRTVAEDRKVAEKPIEMKNWLLDDSKTVEALELGLLDGAASADDLGARMKKIQQSCKDCHAKYRD